MRWFACRTSVSSSPPVGRSWQKLAKLAPSWPQVAPQSAPSGPCWPQVGSKLASKRSKLAQDGPRWPQVGPRWPQDGPKLAVLRGCWGLLGPTWGQHGPNLGPIWPQNRSLEALQSTLGTKLVSEMVLGSFPNFFRLECQQLQSPT